MIKNFTNMKEAYVSFEIAKLLKEKGFDEKTMSYYQVAGEQIMIMGHIIPASNKDLIGYFSETFSRPTHQMVLAYLREKGVYIDIITSFDLNGKDHYSYTIYKNSKLIRKNYTSFDWYYEEATEAAIKYSLENLI